MVQSGECPSFISLKRCARRLRRSLRKILPRNYTAEALDRHREEDDRYLERDVEHFFEGINDPLYRYFDDNYSKQEDYTSEDSSESPTNSSSLESPAWLRTRDLLFRMTFPYLRRPKGRHWATGDILTSTGQLLMCLGLHPSIKKAAAFFLGYSPEGGSGCLAKGMAISSSSEMGSSEKDLGKIQSKIVLSRLIAPERERWKVVHTRNAWKRAFEKPNPQAVVQKIIEKTITEKTIEKDSWVNLFPKFDPVILHEDVIDDANWVKEKVCPSSRLDLVYFDPDLDFLSPGGLMLTVLRICNPRFMLIENLGFKYDRYRHDHETDSYLYDHKTFLNAPWFNWQGELWRSTHAPWLKKIGTQPDLITKSDSHFHEKDSPLQFDGWTTLYPAELGWLPRLREPRAHGVFVRIDDTTCPGISNEELRNSAQFVNDDAKSAQFVNGEVRKSAQFVKSAQFASDDALKESER